MPRHDEPREIGHDDIIAVANECRDEGIDAHEIALALWNLRSTFTVHFGPRSRDIHRQAFLTWKRTIIERNTMHPPEWPRP